MNPHPTVPEILQHLARVLEAVPDDRFTMGAYATDPHGGKDAMFCLVGWTAQDPWFLNVFGSEGEPNPIAMMPSVAWRASTPGAGAPTPRPWRRRPVRPA